MVTQEQLQQQIAAAAQQQAKAAIQMQVRTKLFAGDFLFLVSFITEESRGKA